MMKKEEQQQRAREGWLGIYKQLGSVRKAARRCGIARSTQYRWIRRLPEEGLADPLQEAQKAGQAKDR